MNDDDGTHVTFDLRACGVLYSDLDASGVLTLTGSIEYHGWTGGTDSFDEYHGADLTMVGDLTYSGEEAAVDETCALSASLIETDTSQALSGKLCDRDVTYSLTHAACGG